MSALLDADVVVLEKLGLQPPCEMRRNGPHPAEVAMVCRRCRASLLLCRKHLRRLRRKYMRMEKALSGLVCGVCLVVSKTFDDAIEVVDL